MQRISTIVSIVSVILLLFSLGFFGFVFGSIKTDSVRASELRSELDLESDREQRLKSMEKLLENTTEERDKLERYFVGSDKVVDFIRLVEDTALRFGLRAEIEGVGVEEAEAGYDEVAEFLNVDVLILGTWGEFMNFLRAVESLPYKVTIRRVQNQKIPADRENGGLWDGLIGLRVLKIKGDG